VSNIHVQYHVFIIRAGFISWTPATLENFKLATFNNIFDSFFV
jgi:hypothetical protein